MMPGGGNHAGHAGAQQVAGYPGMGGHGGFQSMPSYPPPPPPPAQWGTPPPPPPPPPLVLSGHAASLTPY